MKSSPLFCCAALAALCAATAVTGCADQADPTDPEPALEETAAPLAGPLGNCYVARPNRPSGDCLTGRYDIATNVEYVTCNQAVVIFNAMPDSEFRKICDAWFPGVAAGFKMRMDVCWQNNTTLAYQWASYWERNCPAP